MGLILVEHAFFDLRYAFVAHEVCGDGKGEFFGYCGAFAGDDVAVADDVVGGEGGALQLVFKSRVACSFASHKEAMLAEDHGCCADGGDEFSAFVVQSEGFAESVVLEEVFGSGHSSWQYERVAIGEFASAEDVVGHHGDVVGSRYGTCAGAGYGAYEESTSAENVESGEGFNFFEAVGEEKV